MIYTMQNAIGDFHQNILGSINLSTEKQLSFLTI